MRCQSDKGNTTWMAPSMCALQISNSLWFIVISQLRCSTLIGAVRQKLSCCWTYIFLTVVGRSLSVLSSDSLVFGTLRSRSSSCATVCNETSSLSKFSISYSGKPSLGKLLSLPDASIVITDQQFGARCRDGVRRQSRVWRVSGAIVRVVQ